MNWLHNWSKWKPYEFIGKMGSIIKVVELRQTRRCETCGKTQDKLIREHQFDNQAIEINDCFNIFDLKELEIE